MKEIREQLDPESIDNLLRELSNRLTERGVQAEMTILGGAAVALAFDNRRVTADIDAIFQPREIVINEAAQIAAEYGLPKDWLNDAVAFYLPRVPDQQPREYAVWPGLVISTGSPEYLLAMKALVSRKSVSDLEDAAVIAHHLRLYDEAQIEQVARKYFPSGAFGAQELWFEDIAHRAQQLRA